MIVDQEGQVADLIRQTEIGITEMIATEVDLTKGIDRGDGEDRTDLTVETAPAHVTDIEIDVTIHVNSKTGGE